MTDEPGVYLLFRQKRLTYVGRSKNPSKRVETHRRNGRPFDYSIEINCPAEDVDWVEHALIEAMNPPQNRLGVTYPRIEPTDPQVTQIIYHAPRQAAVTAPDPHKVMSVAKAKREAESFGFLRDFAAAMWSGELRTYAKNPALDGPGKPRIVTRGDLDDWFESKRKARADAGWRAA